MFGIGGTELFIIVLFVIIIFGPDKIPEMARTAGKAMRMFKKVQEDVEHVIRAEIYTPETLGTGAENPIKAAAAAAVPGSSGSSQEDNAASASAIWADAAKENEEEEGEEE